MAICHMTKLTDRNWHRPKVVTINVQLSPAFDDLPLAKETLSFILALSPRVIQNIEFFVVLFIHFARSPNRM